MFQHALDLPGISNARELGGYSVGERRIKSGLLIRTAGLDHATPEALEKLQNAYHVQTVIDLRMSMESQEVPDPVIIGAENLHLPVMEMQDMLVGIEPEIVRKYQDLQADRMALFDVAYESGMLNDQLYIHFLLDPRGKSVWRHFFEVLLSLDRDRALLWHCTDGKDRTGCAAMLILSALGADRETIMQDYLLTNTYNAQRLEAVRQQVEPLHMPPEKLQAMLFISGGVDAVYMQKALDTLDREYGSVWQYLEQEVQVGFAERQELQRRYLA